MEGLENYDPNKKPAAGDTQSPASPSFLDKAKQYLKVMNDSSTRSGSFGMENRIRAGEAAGAGAIRRHLPDSVNGLIDRANSVPILNHVIQPFEDAGSQSSNETMEQTRDRVSKQLNSQDAQQTRDNPIASTAGTLVGSIPATVGSTGLGTALGDSSLVGKALHAIRNSSSVPKIGGVLADTTQAAVKAIPNIGENAAYSAATDTSDDSITHKLERGALVGASTSPIGALGGTAAKLVGGGLLGGLAGVGAAEGVDALFPKVLGSGVARAAGSEVGNVILDKDNQSTSDTDAAPEVDVDALLQQLGVDSSTPDGAQKSAQINQPDFTDKTKDKDEGKAPSSEVPQVTIKNGRKVLTTPSGQTVELN